MKKNKPRAFVAGQCALRSSAVILVHHGDEQARN
jgi:hypothetical protein